MDEPTPLTSAANPRVKQVVRLIRNSRDRRRLGRFVAEGRRQIERALEAGLDPESVYWCRELCPTLPDALRASPGLNLFTVSRPLCEKMAYRERPEGLLAVFPAASIDWPPTSVSKGDDLWLAAWGLAKPGNLGAVVRSAEAAGCRGVVVVDAVVDAFNPNAIRASTEAVFRLPVHEADAVALAGWLTSAAIRPVVATPEARMAYTDVDLTGPVCVVIGAEDTGVDRDAVGPLLEAGGAAVSIPTLGNAVDSLNASVAAAVILFEAVRQRRASGRRAAD